MNNIINMLNQYFRDEMAPILDESQNNDNTQEINNSQNCIIPPIEDGSLTETFIEQADSLLSPNEVHSVFEYAEPGEDGDNTNTYIDQNTSEFAYLSKEQKDELIKQVIDDSFIKAEKSPFRIFDDDRQEFERIKSYIDLTRIVQQYQNGEITTRMMDILEIIILHKNITSKQIWQIYLLEYGKYIKREHLKTTLDHMVNGGLITRFKISSAMSSSIYHVYTPAYNGVRLYTAIKDNNINWKKADSIQKVYNIKKCLAANQFLIAFLKRYELSYNIHKDLMWARGNGVKKNGSVSPSLELIFKGIDQNIQGNIVFLVEVIRKYNGWEEDFKEKLQRYAMYLRSVSDTQILKKYYIIVCCESDEQILDALRAAYDVTHVQHIGMLKDSMIYFISDLNLLDSNIDGDVLDNLYCFEYKSPTDGWGSRCADFKLTKKNVFNEGIEIDRIDPPKKQGKQQLDEEKQELAVKIYRAIQKTGHDFPISVTKAAIPLREQGIKYQEMGYSRLREMLGDLNEYYDLYHESPTELLISLTAKMRQIINEYIQVDPVRKIGQDQKKYYADDTVKQYFVDGLSERKKWNNRFRNEIFVRNRDMCAAVLSRITSIYDFSAEGWMNIIAYSFHIAKTNNNVMENNKYLCYATGICTVKKEEIYLLAEKNIRIEPKWVFLGLATINSTKRIGDILREEFGIC